MEKREPRMPSRLLLESHTYWLGLIRVIVTTKTHALLVSFKSSDMTHYVHRSVSFRNNIIMPLQMSMVRRNMLLIISTLYHILCKSRILLRFTKVHGRLKKYIRWSAKFAHKIEEVHGCLFRWFRPSIPKEVAPLFRFKAPGYSDWFRPPWSERSDAGLLVLSHNWSFRSSRHIFSVASLLSWKDLFYGRYGSTGRG